MHSCMNSIVYVHVMNQKSSKKGAKNEDINMECE